MSKGTDWIDIKLHAPPLGRGVLATDGKEVASVEFYETHGQLYVGEHLCGGYESDPAFYISKVTHWRELPPPPVKD